MNRLRKDVEKFYRVRVTIEAKDGQTSEYVHGPYTTARKAREIETRLKHWNRLLVQKKYSSLRTFVKVTYDIEETPVIGWYRTSSNAYTNV